MHVIRRSSVWVALLGATLILAFVFLFNAKGVDSFLNSQGEMASSDATVPVDTDLRIRDRVDSDPVGNVKGLGGGDQALITGRVEDSFGTPVNVSLVKFFNTGDGAITEVLLENGKFEAAVGYGLYAVLVPDDLVPEGLLPQLALSPHQLRGELDEAPLLPPMVDTRGERQSASVLVVLQRPGRVNGRVVDLVGQPVENAFVRIQSTLPGLQSLSFDRMTSHDGTFEVKGARPNGDYVLIVMASAAVSVDHRALAPPKPLYLEILAGQELNLPDLVLGGGAVNVRGRVLDQDGIPFSGLKVQCYDGEKLGPSGVSLGMMALYGESQTDDRGEFSFAGLPATRLELQLAAGYEPSVPLGVRKPAFWVSPVEVDARGGSGVLNVGTFQVDRSRPFFIELKFIPDDGKANIRACEVYVEFLDSENGWDSKQEMRPRFQPKSWHIDSGDEPIRWGCETPIPPVLFRVIQNGVEVHRLEVNPFPNGSISETLIVEGI